MNPFVLNKMHGAFVPDRLTDIAATTPAVSPEPTVQPQHTHIEAGTDLNNISTMGYYVGASQQPPIVEKTIAVSIYRFDVAHRGDITMLMADGDAVNVVCDVVVEDDCRGVDMLSHVFGFAVMPKMAVFIEHDGNNTQRVMETLSRLYYEENPLLFVVVTHADLDARVKLTSKSLVFMNLGARDYGCKGVIYFNEDMVMRIMAHEQRWRDLVPTIESDQAHAAALSMVDTAKRFMSQADMTRYLDDIPDKDYEPSCVTVDYLGSLDRHPTLDRAISMLSTPMVDTEYYRHLRQNMGLPMNPTTESHLLTMSDLPLASLLSDKHHGHVHVGSDNERRVGMITGVPEQERFFVPHGGPITTNTNDLIAMMAEADVQVTIGADIGLESKSTPPMRHTHQDYRDGQWHAPYTDDDSKSTK